MPITRAPYFSPTQIGGCALWLDAADSSTMTFSSGSNVTAWNDKINGKSFTGLATFSNYSSDNTSLFFTQATAPLKYLTNTSLSIAPPYTLFSVALLANPINANERVINGLTGTYDTNLFVGNYLNNATVFTGNGSTWNGANSQSYGSMSNVWSITAASIATSNVNAYFNGAPQTQQVGTVTTPTLTGLNIGGGYGTLTNQGDTNYQPFGGYVGEILFYTGTLTTDQRQKVEAYLAQKWGLVGSMAQGHLGTTATLYRSVKVGTTYKPLYTQFNPTSIPGCQLWLDASDTTTITGTTSVTAWKDKSGYGRNPTIFGAPNSQYGTINGVKAMWFDGSSGTWGNFSNAGATVSGFAVGTMNSGTPGYGRMIGLGNSGGNDDSGSGYCPLLLRQSGNQAICTRRFSTDHIYSSYTYDTPFLAAPVYDGTNGTLYVNGSSIVQYSATGNFGYSNYSVGCGIYSITANTVDTWKGFVGEVILYNTALTTTQRQTIESYLAQKWGLTTSLPSFGGPTAIPGCSLWLDGADPAGTGVVPSNGATLSSWVDKSASGNAPNVLSGLTYSSGQQNSLGAVNLGNFTGYLSGTITPALQNSVMSCFFIYKLNTTTSDNGIHNVLDFSNGPNGDLRMLEERGGNIRVVTRNPNTLAISTPANTGVYNIWFTGQNTTNLYASLNGTSLTSVSISANTSNSSQYGIGTNFETPFATPSGWNGFIGEIIIYNSLLSLSQRQQVEGYLAAKWGLQASLSNGHPYSTSAPTNHINNTQPAGLPAIETLATAQKGTANLSYLAGLSYFNVGATYWDKWQLYLQRFTSANSGAVATYTSNAVTGAGGGFNGGVLAPNGKIYCIGASNIGIIDPTTNALSLTATTTSAFYGGHVLAPNGKIYCIPADTTGVIGVVDPTTNTFSTPISGTAVSSAYNGGVLAPNGKIYCMPYRATNVGVIDPVANTFTTFGSISDGTSSGAYNAGVVAPNGKIYCIPRYATAVGVIDPALNTFTSFGTTATYSTGAYIGGVLAPNGKIYCIPLGAPTVAVIDPVLNTFTTNTISGTLPGGYAYYGGVLGPDGKIYCIPLSSTNVGVIDPVANTFTTFGTSPSTAYYGGVLAPNGKIYCIPYNGSLSPGIISFSGLSQLPNSNYCLSAYTNKL